jgi:hypothetical protein
MDYALPVLWQRIVGWVLIVLGIGAIGSAAPSIDRLHDPDAGDDPPPDRP